MSEPNPELIQTIKQRLEIIESNVTLAAEKRQKNCQRRFDPGGQQTATFEYYRGGLCLWRALLWRKLR